MSEHSEDVMRWVQRALRRPVATDPGCKARIMDLVRAVPPAWPHARRRRRARPGWASPVVQLALAASIVGVMAVGTLRPRAQVDAARAMSAVSPDHETVVSTLRDTLRLVRFMFVDSGASRVALAGDFNRWSAHSTPLARAGERGVWSVAVALAPGRHVYAFVVDDSQWVADPLAPRSSASSGGRPESVMMVPVNPN
ncbi:MAG TPA: isoamylase early set domain-containing protein [Gemmatimonadaceae bacterium]|nr:isoamylase early set domain-containing protein [Gemmatimonadaceae bacterium]